MIGIYNKAVCSIPILEVVDQSNQDQQLPLFVYFHGFTSAKEHNLPIAYLLAKAGFRVILPDSLFHGERTENVSKQKVQTSFWDIVMKNVEELEIIKNDYEKKGLIQDERIGVSGTSMGGITTSAALTKYHWITVAAILMGTPKMTTYAKDLIHTLQKTGKLPVSDDQIEQLYEQIKLYDLSRQTEKLKERPLLLWHGQQDEVVPFDHAYSFYKEIQKNYNDPARLQFLKEVNTGHKVSRNAIVQTVKWFEKYL